MFPHWKYTLFGPRTFNPIAEPNSIKRKKSVCDCVSVRGRSVACLPAWLLGVLAESSETSVKKKEEQKEGSSSSSSNCRRARATYERLTHIAAEGRRRQRQRRQGQDLLENVTVLSNVRRRIVEDCANAQQLVRVNVCVLVCARLRLHINKNNNSSRRRLIECFYFLSAVFPPPPTLLLILFTRYRLSHRNLAQLIIRYQLFGAVQL